MSESIYASGTVSFESKEARDKAVFMLEDRGFLITDDGSYKWSDGTGYVIESNTSVLSSIKNGDKHTYLIHIPYYGLNNFKPLLNFLLSTGIPNLYYHIDHNPMVTFCFRDELFQKSLTSDYCDFLNLESLEVHIINSLIDGDLEDDYYDHLDGMYIAFGEKVLESIQ